MGQPGPLYTTHPRTSHLARQNTENRTVQEKGGPRSHRLFSHGLCKWAGCDTRCDTLPAFLAHLHRNHVLDDRSTAQTKARICDYK